MKEEWKYLRLGDVCDFISGYTPSKNLLSKLGDVPYYKVSDMNTKGNELYMVSTLLYVSNPRKIFPKGSIVFPKNGGAIFTNKKRILSFDSVVDLNTEAIIPNAQYVTTDFLYKLFLDIDLSQFDNGGGLPSINIRKMQSHEVPVPPISEQQQIVSFLDAQFAKIDAIKANAEKQLQDAKALFQNALKDLLMPEEKWTEYKLPTLCKDLFAGGDAPADKSKEASNEFLYPIYSNGIENAGLYGYSKKYRVAESALTISARGTIGAVFIRKVPFTPIVRLITLIPNTEIILLEFFYYLLINCNLGNTGSSIPQLTIPNLKELRFQLPHVDRQKEIAKKLSILSEKIEKIKSNYDQKIALCNDLKKSLLKDIFN